MVKKLSSLLQFIKVIEIKGPKEVLVSGICDDSRKVKNGDLFVAIKGLTVDAHRFIDQVVIDGANVIVVEVLPASIKPGVTYIKVNDSREALSLLASAWFGNPASKMKVIGVTGTDGKTTAVNIIYWLLKSAGYKVGMVSTVSAKIGDKEYDTGFHVTNPEPLLLQKFLAKMVKEGCEYIVLEVTSHGLDQKRVSGIKFDVGVLTNITHEHLDYHKTFESYRNTKAKLFENVKVAVLNKDDSSYSFVKEVVSKNAEPISYAVGRCDVDYFAAHFNFYETGADITIEAEKSLWPIETSLIGKYNISNVLAAIAVARFLEVSWNDITKALKTFQLPAGRLEKIRNNEGINIFVDFAHTPNALENVLTTLKKQTKGKLIAVVGCAGERDKEKRPMMGEIAMRIADYSIFTAEDPRSEDVNEIINQMVKGISESISTEFEDVCTNDLNHWYRKGKKGGVIKSFFTRIPERGEAIWFAINKLAKKGDTVVICGKGHEKSMCYGSVEYSWSDQEAVESALKGKKMEIKWQVQS